MKIDIETVRYYSGLGDLVMLAWLAEGSKTGSDPLVFHRKRDPGLTELLGMQTDLEPGGVSMDAAFDIEVVDHGRKPRLDYIRQFLGIKTPLVRPALRISPEDEAWARQTAAELDGPPVILFPQCVWKPREWPASHWVDLAWKLKGGGIPVLLMYQGDDTRFRNTPLYHWNVPIPRIAALMKHASLVVGNDSFPAHLAGTVGTPTIALMGPTKATVFAHMPGVECLASGRIDCTGCHFQAPFRAACDQGCQSLFRLFPEEVFARIMVRLRTRR
ncbi:glycosyltransferase family 9 protein [Zavarzinella formosa]|uniref:glycosyltransferase family 9 protein n=1 Tax=Zavarzinella formosa TaxID=360055 RepID=UPI0002ED7344|nr:glycosyltransferase family 9 protein [Zavarzinella formosa]